MAATANRFSIIYVTRYARLKIDGRLDPVPAPGPLHGPTLCVGVGQNQVFRMTIGAELLIEMTALAADLKRLGLECMRKLPV